MARKLVVLFISLASIFISSASFSEDPPPGALTVIDRFYYADWNEALDACLAYDTAHLVALSSPGCLSIFSGIEEEDNWYSICLFKPPQGGCFDWFLGVDGKYHLTRFSHSPWGQPCEYISETDGCVAANEDDDPEKNEGESDCTEGNPISLGTGNKFQKQLDYLGRGAFPLRWQRNYNSKSGRWRFLQTLEYVTGANQAKVIRRDGKIFTFNQVDAVWQSDADVVDGLEQLFDINSAHIGWRYTVFDQDLVEEYDTTGQLVKVTNRNGLTHTYVRSGSTTTIADSFGHVLSFTEDTNNRIVSMVDPENGSYVYSYDTNGNLTQVFYPQGETRVYHYEDTNFPNALTGITDANGDRFATWTYDGIGRAISSEHLGGAERVTMDHTNLDHDYDPRTIVTNALGKQTTYHFRTFNGVRKVVQVEGHASENCVAANKDYTYDTSGFMASKTDWKGNTTTYIRNTKGQELSRTEAAGTQQERIITTEWHPTFNLRTKVIEPDRETIYTYDANGNLLSQQRTDLATP